MLVCPLDWGLGHATRSIPVIRALQRHGADVMLASSGPAGKLLQQEFPELFYHELPSYSPHYPNTGSMMVTMFGQLAKFARVARQEHHVVEELVHKHSVEAVISDNRFGCYSSRVKSIFITHQLHVVLPSGWSFLSPIVNYFCHRYIRRYHEVWVPDQPGSGLTEPFTDLHVKSKFVGWLSRFQGGEPVEKKYDVAIVVSGPEPQRAIFVSIVLNQLRKLNLKALVVTGEPGNSVRRVEGHVQIVGHLGSSELEEALMASDAVVCRSGYSTIMDLIVLGKKAIFVPTPQQPEQLLLARHLHGKGIAFSVQQEQFVLDSAIKQGAGYQGLSVYRMDPGLLEKELLTLFI